MDQVEQLQAQQLREQLSDLFGLSSKQFESDDDSNCFSPQDAEDLAEPINGDALDDDNASLDEAESVVPASDCDSGEVDSLQTQESGEITVEAYMEQLLARSRGSQLSVTGAVSKKNSEQSQSTSVASQVGTSLSQGAAHSTEQNGPVSDQHVSRTTKTKAERKFVEINPEQLRAHLDSFREVAIESARNAVAISAAKREKTRYEQLKLSTGVCWLGTICLLLTGIFIQTWILFLAFLAAGGSIYLSLQLVRCHKIAKGSNTAHEIDVLSSDSEREKSASDCSTTLTESA